jgi:hypothetical protein
MTLARVSFQRGANVALLRSFNCLLYDQHSAIVRLLIGLQPTRTTLTSISTLDLILCNDLNFIFGTNVSAPFSTSDHCVVDFKIIRNISNRYSNVVSSYNFDRANWSGVCTFLNRVNFADVFSKCNNIGETIDSLYDIINQAIATNVPVVQKSRKAHYFTYPAHITRRLRRKATAWKIYKSFRTAESYDKYKRMAAECRNLIHQYILHREDTIITSSNVNKFYRYANNKFCCKSAIGPLRDSAGNVVTDPCYKAELLSKVFSDSFTADNNRCPVMPCLVSDDTSLSSIVFTPGLVRKAIKHIQKIKRRT